jgi:hypothetical protein
MSGPLRIAPMDAAGLGLAIGWAAAEGWNPGLDDAGPFLAADRRGFLMGTIDGEPVACASAVRYGEAFGFLGLYICRPGVRGQGHGWALWQAAMAHLGGRTIGLDGVVAQQANYRKSGFALAHRNIRYGGAPDVPEVSRAGIEPVAGALVEAVLAYDGPFFPAPRERFMRGWLNPRERTALALVRDGEVTGYGVIRQCLEGWKIGPLFADDPAAATALFAALVRDRAGPVFLDVPEPNGPARRLAEAAGLSPMFETARMYRGPQPDLPLPRTFGITTFELG